MSNITLLKDFIDRNYAHGDFISVNYCASCLCFNWRTVKSYLYKLCDLKCNVKLEGDRFLYYDYELEFNINDFLLSIEHLSHEDLIHEYNELFSKFKETGYLWRQYVKEKLK